MRTIVERGDHVVVPERGESIHDHFGRIAADLPDAVAVRSDRGAVTYAELDRDSDLIARQIVNVSEGSKAPVGLLLGHDDRMVAGILGALKAGRPYLPLDPRSPHERLAGTLADSGPSAIVCDPEWAMVARGLSPRGMPIVDLAELSPIPGDFPRPSVSPDGLAAILYTSGSTGRPKGVCIDHRTLLHNARTYTRGAGLSADDRLALTAPFHAAASTSNLFGSLLNGAELLPIEPQRAGLLGLVERLRVRRATVWHSVPTLFRSVVDAMPPGTRLPDLRVVRLGGETVYRRDLESLRGRFADRCILFLSYSSTETLSVCHARFGPDDPGLPDRLPVGRPVDGAEVSIVGPDGRPSPRGEAGEIVVRSRYLSPGYWSRTSQAHEPFAAGPRESGPRRYRTGDLGRLLPDGRLEHLGRLDDRVKVRGHRVDVTEVEAVIRDLGCASRAAVVARHGRPGEADLVAYIVPPEGGPVPVAEIRRRLLSRLPEPMVPSRFVVRQALPETESGKLDRRALLSLPEPAEGEDAEGSCVRPRDALEEQILAIWAEVLPGHSVGIRDNFFDLGGHSLTAAQVVARVARATGVDLPPSSFFANPTVSALAAEVRRRRESAEAGPDVAGLRPRPVLRRRPDPDGPAPASFAQRRMWFLDQLEGGLLAYNMPYAFRINGALDVAALRRSFEAITARHEPLRTTFALHAGGPAQVVRPHGPFHLPVMELRGLPAGERDREAARLIDEEADRPFDLARDPMLRASLLRTAEDEHILLVTLHHITADGWSMRVLWRELAAGYREATAGSAGDWPELEVPYTDYARWQHEDLGGGRLDGLLRYWRGQLEGLPPLELASDRPRGPRHSYRGTRHEIALPAPLVVRLRRLGRDAGVTLYMTLLAGLRALLSRHTGSHDIAVATPVAARTHPALEPMIGFFANTLVIRVAAPASVTFRELLERVRRATLEAYDHQDLPFDRLVEELRPERELGRSPLVQVLFQVLSLPDVPLAFDGLEVDQLSVAGRRARFDLEIHLRPQGDGVRGAIVYSTELFDAATIGRFAEHFANLLEAVAEAPDRPLDRLELLSEGEIRTLEEWGRGPVGYPREQTIHERFAAQAARTPEAIAVIGAGRTLGYRELSDRAGRLAHHLIDRGVRVGERVGVAVDRSPEMIVALLGILEAGAAYVPLDLSSPPSRLAFLCDDAGLRMIVTRQSIVDRLPPHGPPAILVDAPDIEIGRVGRDGAAPRLRADEWPAYLMYTSGSTGRPKGVLVAHRSVIRLIAGNGFARLGPDEVFLQLAPLAFDASTFEIWGPLLHGGRLVQAPDGIPDLEEIEQLIRLHAVTTVWLTARLFDRIVDERPSLLAPLRQVLTGGEALSVSHVRRALQAMAPGTVLINGYGPTECTTFACCHPILADPGPDATSVPIGRPIAGTTAFVLDEHRQLVPIGAPGELYLGGDGLAIGYLGHPELTADRFVAGPAGQGRLYRTGDRARWRSDGNLEFLGRIDGQIKLRGFRIEPGEVEAALASHEEVSTATVLLREGPEGEPRLVAYWAPRGSATASPAELREHLRRLLPPYMVPSAFVRLERIPLTPNGKVDRPALPPIDLGAEVIGALAPPCTATEHKMSALWAVLLGVGCVDVDQNFFDLGGHSLLAVKLIDRISREFGRRLPLSALFTTRNLRELAAALDTPPELDGSIAVVPLRPSGHQTPLIFLPSLAGDTVYAREIAGHLCPDRPVFGIEQGPVESSRDRPLEELAARCVEGLLTHRPAGAYSLAGYSFGGMLAYETARQLRLAGREVRALAIIDTGPKSHPNLHPTGRAGVALAFLRNLPWWLIDDLLRTSPEDWTGRLRRYLRPRQPGGRMTPEAHLDVNRVSTAQLRQIEENLKAVVNYHPRPYAGRITLLRARARPLSRPRAGDLGWGRLAGGGVAIQVIPGSHASILKPPYLGQLARSLQMVLD